MCFFFLRILKKKQKKKTILLQQHQHAQPCDNPLFCSVGTSWVRSSRFMSTGRATLLPLKVIFTPIFLVLIRSGQNILYLLRFYDWATYSQKTEKKTQTITSIYVVKAFYSSFIFMKSVTFGIKNPKRTNVNDTVGHFDHFCYHSDA